MQQYIETKNKYALLLIGLFLTPDSIYLSKLSDTVGHNNPYYLCILLIIITQSSCMVVNEIVKFSARFGECIQESASLGYIVYYTQSLRGR